MDLDAIKEFIIESNAIEGIHDDEDSLLYTNHLYAFMDMLYSAVLHLIPDPLSFHALLMEGVIKSYGRYRDIQVVVGNHRPPAPVFVPSAMQDWHDALNQDSLNMKTLSLERCWHYHHWFETIHPFEDGNGRVGRLILAQMCLMSGHDLPIVKASERFAYYAEIEKWRKENMVR